MKLLKIDDVVLYPRGFGSSRKTELYYTTRGGTKSPISWYYKWNGKWISEYEIKVRYKTPPHELHAITYLFKVYFAIKDATFDSENALLKHVPREEGFSGIRLGLPAVYWKTCK